MAHFTELDENDIVLRVVVVSNNITIIPNPSSPEIEQRGINFCKGLYGKDTKWKQTSYNTHRGSHAHGKSQNRKNYAGIGYKYDVTRNAFIPPAPYPSWVIDENTCVYEAPVPYPDDGNSYGWNEQMDNWVISQP